MKEIKLYDEFSEKELLDLFNKKELDLVETTIGNMWGDFFIIEGYAFKKCLTGFSCLSTPKESHEVVTPGITKAKGDRGKNYYTRYKNKHGGKEEFNPVTKTGGREEIADTKKRLNL